MENIGGGMFINLNMTKISCLVGFLCFSNVVFSVQIMGRTQPIKGHAPMYNDKGAENKLGFEFDGKYLNKAKNEDTQLVYSEPLKSLLSHVLVEPLVATQDYEITDEDGEELDSAKINIDGYKISVSDAKGNEIDLASLNDTDTICTLSESGKYTLPITASVSANYMPETKFGNPNSGNAMAVNQSYTFDIAGSCSGGKILYLKPMDSRDVYNNSEINGFVNDKGFLPTATSDESDSGKYFSFPSNGFDGASFVVELDGEKDDYKIEVKPVKTTPAVIDDAVSINGNVVTFISAFKGSAELIVTRIADNAVVDKHEFTIRHWFQPGKPTSSCAMETSNAAQLCKTVCRNSSDAVGVYRVPAPEYLTTVKSSDAPQRKIGSLYGEWGPPIVGGSSALYPKSKLQTFSVTSDLSKVPSSYVVVNLANGKKEARQKGLTGSIVCMYGPADEGTNPPAPL